MIFEKLIPIIMIYKNTKAMVYLPDSDTNFFDIVMEFSRKIIGIISIYNLPRLHTTNINWSNERKWLHTQKKQKQDPAETITDANYMDNLALLVNKSAQAESLLYSLEQAALVNGNPNKIAFMCFNQDGAISNFWN